MPSVQRRNKKGSAFAKKCVAFVLADADGTERSATRLMGTGPVEKGYHGCNRTERAGGEGGKSTRPDGCVECRGNQAADARHKAAADYLAAAAEYEQARALLAGLRDQGKLPKSDWPLVDEQAGLAQKARQNGQ